MNNRLKEINDLVELIIPQDKFENNINSKITYFFNNYKEQLENYTFVKSKEELYELKLSGYIRYFDLYNNIKFGGILIKVFQTKNDIEDKKKNILLLQNSDGIRWSISWENNFIFYKNQTKKGDHLRNIFISLTDN